MLAAAQDCRELSGDAGRGARRSPVSEMQTGKILYKGYERIFGCISLQKQKENLGDLPAPSWDDTGMPKGLLLSQIVLLV